MELRALLSDSAAEPKFIQTLPRLGYRLLVPVSSEQPTTVPERESAPLVDIPAIQEKESKPEGAVARGRENLQLHWDLCNQPRIPGAAGALYGGSPQRSYWHFAAVTLLGWQNWFRKANPPAQHEVRQMIAVLPFENLTGDPAQEYFSDGLTEEMIDQLGRLDPARLGVIGRNSVMRYKTIHEATAAIGRELGVSYLLEGSVRRDSDEVRISAQLIQVQDQASVWSRQYDRQLRDVLALQSEIAREIAGGIHLTLDDAARNAGATAQPQTAAANDAYDLYLRGLYFWNKRGADNIKRATDYFQQSIRRDPNSARAYSGLAESYALVSGYAGVPPKDFLQKADAAARRAVALDPNLAEAHVAMAVVAQDCDSQSATAEREYRRAIELNPNYATAHHWYGEYLALMGRFDESRAQMEHARQLATFSRSSLPRTPPSRCTTRVITQPPFSSSAP